MPAVHGAWTLGAGWRDGGLELAARTGLGVSGRLGTEPGAAVWVPIHGLVSVDFPYDSSVQLRGGANLRITDGGYALPRVAPEIVLGVTAGQAWESGRIGGIRFELGYRIELGKPTWTGVIGVAL